MSKIMTDEFKESLKFSPEIREQNIRTLKTERFDVLVIGGGITGAGIVRDAVLRGFKTALIEKDDFAAGTSTKSSKLVHGGFRYLKQMAFGLVHEALVERKILMDIAPHIVHPTKCLLPIYENSAEPPFLIHMGMWMYDILAFTKNIGRHRMVSAKELAILEPELRQEGLKKGAEYYDCKEDDFRLVMATIQSAAQHGATIANYIKAKEIIRENGKIAGILAENRLTGESVPIKARVIANATGPWSDEIRSALFNEHDPHVRTTKGVHLIVKHSDLPITRAFMQFAIQDKRPIFAVPWKTLVLLGTTDTDYAGNLDRIYTERSDVDYLLESFNYYFPKANLNDDKILSAFAGLRPLLREEGKSASEVTREHAIFEAPENFFSIIGGKLTTYRVMAKDMVHRLSRRLERSFSVSPKNPHCITDKVPLYGGGISNYETFRQEWVGRLVRENHFDHDIAEHFVESFGTRIPDVLKAVDATPDGRERIHPNLPHVWGELTYALEHGMTLALDDFLIRRTHIFSLEKHQGLDVYPGIADRLQARLGWSEDEKQKQIDRLKLKVHFTQYFREEPSHENPIHRQS